MRILYKLEKDGELYFQQFELEDFERFGLPLLSCGYHVIERQLGGCFHPVMRSCKCGQNVICPICGFGHGNMPCNCSGAIQYPI